MAHRVGEFTPSDRAKIGESTLPLELFLSFWNPNDAGVRRGMQLIGRDVKVKKIRQVQWGDIRDNAVDMHNFFFLFFFFWW